MDIPMQGTGAAEELILPGFGSEQESLRALRNTSPQLALMALMSKASHEEYLCIGRDEDGQPTAVVVDREEFLAWLNVGQPARRAS